MTFSRSLCISSLLFLSLSLRAVEANASCGNPNVADIIQLVESVLTVEPAPCYRGGVSVTSQPLTTGQTTAYGTGSDGDLQKGAARSYTDNGDGTITDNSTGLMWEKKSQDGSIHDYGNEYTWCGASCGGTNIMDGTITTTFLATLNAGAGFAGHTDWRIPNQNELLSLVNYQNLLPAVDAAFNTSCAGGCTVLTCSCTQSSTQFPYWSSSTYQDNPTYAWAVYFSDGDDAAGTKSSDTYVRAVRGGS